ncbi:MAG: nucleotide sugar dehydrogenase [Sulfobacillus sp.]
MPRRVAIVGLGFVGLPVALSFARRGVIASGLDISQSLVAELSGGHSRLLEQDGDLTITDILSQCLQEGTFTASTDPEQAYRDVEAILISVGLPVSGQGVEFAPLDQAVASMLPHLRKGLTILLRTTVPPGTTARHLVQPIEAAGWKVGQDLFVAYVPERLAEGRAFAETKEMPVLVGAPDQASRLRAADLMKLILDAPCHQTDSYEAAELAKLAENGQRDANVALSQEIARLSEALKLSAREVIRLTNTHPRVRLLDPGPGVGGACLPNAYLYMAHAAAEVRVAMPTFRAARDTNDRVPELLVDLALSAPRPNGKVKAAVWGLAMKDNSMDDRQSPAMAVVQGLLAKGFSVSACDPLVQGYPFQVSTPAEAAAGASVLYALVRQPGLDPIDPQWLDGLVPGALVVDARGMFHGLEAEIAGRGLTLWSL